MCIAGKYGAIYVDAADGQAYDWHMTADGNYEKVPFKGEPFLGEAEAEADME